MPAKNDGHRTTKTAAVKSDSTTCPLLCIPYQDREIHDEYGTVTATHCHECGHLVTRSQWREALTGTP